MHPEIVRDEPGSCPICGMALEPMTPTAGEAENPELADMTRRFWIGAALSAPLLGMAMAEHFGPHSLHAALTSPLAVWVQLILATPVVLWGGAPFFRRGWESIANRHLNMFTLIALGTGVAYLYSLVAALAPGIFPASFRTPEGDRAGLFRGGGGHRDAGAARAGAGTARPLANLERDPRPARPRAEACAPGPRRTAARRDIALDAVVPGNRLRVRPGEKVPVDGVVLEGTQRGRRIDDHAASRCRSRKVRATG